MSWLRIALITVVVSIAAGFVIAAFVGVAMRSGDDDAEAQPGVFATPMPRDPPVTFASLPPGYRIENVVSGIEAPSALDGAPDGRIFITEQFSGRVRVVRDGTLMPEPFWVVDDLYRNPDAGIVDELGLVGVTVDPDTSDGIFVYVYYHAEAPDGRRSSKLVRLRDDNGRGADPVVLLEVEASPICCHIGGSLTWMPDGTLLVGVGDHDQTNSGQDPHAITGTILRINRDGTAPPDNPFADGASGDPRVFAYGLRNPFGVAVGRNGEMYVLDNGEFGFDTIHRLKPGANYGWPAHAVAAGTTIEQPLITFLESMGMAGAAFYDDGGPLTEFAGSMFWCQFHRGGAVHRFVPEPGQFEVQDSVISTSCSSGIRVLPDGFIYFLDYVTGSLLRIVK